MWPVINLISFHWLKLQTGENISTNEVTWFITQLINKSYRLKRPCWVSVSWDRKSIKRLQKDFGPIVAYWSNTRYRQSHYIKVAQEDIFIEQKMKFGLVLGLLVILKKKVWVNYDNFWGQFFMFSRAFFFKYCSA